jgi:hypothetical protein
LQEAITYYIVLENKTKLAYSNNNNIKPLLELGRWVKISS